MFRENLGFVEAVQNEISRSRGVKQFTSNGKFQVPDGVSTVYLSGCAAGGGGGGGGCRTNTSEFGGGGGGGGGGGAGQSVIKRAITVKPGEMIDVVIGTTSVNSDGKAGGVGGNTVFGNYLTSSPVRVETRWWWFSAVWLSQKLTEILVFNAGHQTHR
ncbi:hypothetical protein G5574_10535 [Pantoea stewartii]|uniref:hypothetical protein n=1 Tax=Pantoea stewartii TaxID=66269 RepID=UPI0013DDD643|nr:hypothetical protein [Pantoea stewartii]QIE97369.1 hypothetical protein G5574_10535 [Pantoea stewartii]